LNIGRYIMGRYSGVAKRRESRYVRAIWNRKLEQREVGVKREDIPALVERTFKWANESGNPREVSKKQLRELYEKAL
jgi:alcohol dehydrogenase class IV